MDKKLLKAAKELNEKLQCDPPINLEDMELCSDGILQAAELIDPSDGVSKFTMNLIADLKRDKEKATELDDTAETETEKTLTEEETNTLVEEAVNSTILEDFQAAKKLKDLKELAEQNPKIFGEINLEAFSGFEGPRLLKAEMKKYLPVPAEKEIEKPEKKTGKIPKVAKENKPPKGVGVIATIAACIENSGKTGVSKEEILEKLVATFPDRDAAGMKKTINIQVSSRISKEKFKVVFDNTTKRYFKG